MRPVLVVITFSLTTKAQYIDGIPFETDGRWHSESAAALAPASTDYPEANYTISIRSHRDQGKYLGKMPAMFECRHVQREYDWFWDHDKEKLKELRVAGVMAGKNSDIFMITKIYRPKEIAAQWPKGSVTFHDFSCD